tara:strand:- start:2007 stop:2564 length:558 start_codon:yes stop_codon:yes gene_type:complete
MVKKSSKTDIGKKVSKTADSVVKNTAKVTDDIINNSSRSGSNKPLVIDLYSLKLTIQISSIIKIIIFAIFLTYVLKLEKEHCECSEGWEREYIKYYSLAVIIFAILQIAFTFEYAKMNIIHTILGIGGLVFIFSVVKYIRDLKKDECLCSQNWKRTVLNIYAWLSIILLIITFVATLVLFSKINK